MNDVTKDLLEALLIVARMAEDLKKPCGMDPESPQSIRNTQYMNISYAARAAITRAEAALAGSDGTQSSAEERRLRRMLCLQRHGVSAYMDDGEASFGGDKFQRPTDYLRESLDSIEQVWREAGLKQDQAALAAPQPEALEQARADEREACATLSDQLWAKGPGVVMAAIRARGKK